MKAITELVLRMGRSSEQDATDAAREWVTVIGGSDTEENRDAAKMLEVVYSEGRAGRSLAIEGRSIVRLIWEIESDSEMVKEISQRYDMTEPQVEAALRILILAMSAVEREASSGRD
jgi:hypothetical protein